MRRARSVRSARILGRTCALGIHEDEDGAGHPLGLVGVLAGLALLPLAAGFSVPLLLTANLQHHRSSET